MIRLTDPLEHRPTTRELVIAGLATLAILLAIGENQAATTKASPDPMTYTQCAEDDPCWDCQTMGNHVCGPASSEESATP